VTKELNQTALRFMTQEYDQNQCIHGRPQKYFQGATSKFCLSFSDCWRGNANVHKTFCLLYVISLC